MTLGNPDCLFIKSSRMEEQMNGFFLIGTKTELNISCYDSVVTRYTFKDIAWQF